MYLENDYTKTSECRKSLASQKDEICANQNITQSEDELQYYLEYCRIKESQFKKLPNLEKKQDILNLYEQLKELVFINGGKISLSIDEEQLRGTIVCWNPYLFIIEESDEPTRMLFQEIIGNYPLICIESVGEGIQITVETDMFDEIMVTDKSDELERIRLEIKKLKNDKN